MSLQQLYQEVVSPFHNVIYQLERDGFKVDESVRQQLTKDTKSELKHLKKEIEDAAASYISHWLPPLQPNELGSCSTHPDYRGKTKRSKCEGCVRVYQQMQRLRADARGLLAEQRARWGAGFSGEFKIRSDAHWRRLLFDASPAGLGIKANARRRTRKQKLAQIDKDAIAELSRLHPEMSILKLKARFDTLEHDLSTYLPVEVDARGHVLASYHMMTSTGRLGSDNPNMQNIPDRMRKMYVADDAESVLVQADWRQVEALVTAWLANDDEMAGVILDGSRDIHTENALVLADSIGFKGLTAEQADSIPFPNDPSGRSFRQAGKLTHKLHYGMGADKFSRTYGISRQICQKIIEAYFSRWVKLAAWQRSTEEEAAQTRQLSTCFWRVLHFYNFNKKGRLLDREEALAFRPQSIVGDMIKVVGRRLYDRLNGLPNVRLVTTTHDSWTLSTHQNLVDDTIFAVKQIMEQPWPQMGRCGKIEKLWCPVDIAVGRNWQKYHATKNAEGLKKWKDAQPAVAKV